MNWFRIKIKQFFCNHNWIEKNQNGFGKDSPFFQIDERRCSVCKKQEYRTIFNKIK